MKKEIIIDAQYYYTLYQDTDTGEFYLRYSVPIGAGIEDIKSIKLTDDERRGFVDEGKIFIDSLVRVLVKTPEVFGDRIYSGMVL